MLAHNAPDRRMNLEKLFASFKRKSPSVRAHYYRNHEPESEGIRNFCEGLKRYGYRVITKLRKDSSPRSDCDLEIATDVMRVALKENPDAIWLISGSSSFTYLLREIRTHNPRTKIYVVGITSSTARELRELADGFFELLEFGEQEGFVTPLPSRTRTITASG